MSEDRTSENGDCDVRIQWDVRIPMRDGDRLSAVLYVPRSAAATPAIFTLTPYIAQTHHKQAMYFAKHGYVFLSVDVRGRGNSDGVFQPLMGDGEDGYDSVEWIARQPWCNGQVAMWGGSYMGFTQWATAAEHPPHLSTIVPVAAACAGVDFPMRSNISTPYVVQWLTLVAGRASQEQMFADQAYWNQRLRHCFEAGEPFAELDAQLGLPSNIFKEWIAHPSLDEFWAGYNPRETQYAKMSLPVLTITGAYDDDQPGALHHYRQHLANSTPEARARHCLVIGPWDHAGTRIPKREFSGVKVGPASLLDMQALHLQWYDWTLRRGERPAFLSKNVAYYVIGADEWRYAETLEAATAGMRQYALRSTCNPGDVFESGVLCSEAGGGPDEYIYDPRDISLAQLEATVDPENYADQRMTLAARGRILVYHSAPLDEDTEVTGFPRFSAWLAIDQPDTDFQVSIWEVSTDGSAVQLSADWMRARYRQSLCEEQLVHTSEPLLYEFDRFTFVSRRIPRGHRLRLVIGPVNSIYKQKNYNSGGPVSAESRAVAHPVRVRLYHDAVHQSTLFMPLGATEE